MKLKAVRLLALVSAMSMIATIAIGCKKGPDSQSEDSEYVYIAETIPFPSGLGNIGSVAYFGGKVYFVTSKFEYGNAENAYLFTFVNSLYSMNIDGTGLAELTGYAPPVTMPANAGGNIYVEKMIVDDEGGLWLAEKWFFYKYDLPADFDTGSAGYDEMQSYYAGLESGCVLRKIDATGRELLSIDISGLSDWQDGSSIYALAIDSSENIYVSAPLFQDRGSEITVLDNAGGVQFRLDANSIVEQFVHMPDGSIAFPAEPSIEAGNAARALQIIDVSARAFGETVSIPAPGRLSFGSAFGEIYTGGGDFDVFINDNANVYGFSFGEDEAVPLLNWAQSNVISGSIRDIAVMPDGRIVCVNYIWGDVTRMELLVLTKILRSELPEKTVLTLAVIWLNQAIGDEVVKFNTTNLHYRIEIADYSQFNSADDMGAGLARLNTELSSGKVPDILAILGLPDYVDYAASGLLADLYPFIDADPVFSRSDFVEAAFQAAEIDGGLYYACSGFNLHSIVGHPIVVGSDMGWNMQEFEDVLDAHPDADLPLGDTGEITKTSFLMRSIVVSMGDYIDDETGAANFDTPSFIRLLEVSNRLPSGDGSEHIPREEAIATGRQILESAWIYNFYEIQYLRHLFGGEIVCKGFPNESRDGHTLYANENALAIAESSPNKEGAWAFVRTVLDKDWQLANSWHLPTNQAAFDQKIADALETDIAGRMYIGYYEVVRATQAEIDVVLALIDSASGIATGRAMRTINDEALINIILEGASDYFNGVRSAEDAAKVIQSRVSIYISERS